jgi:hypothetical protein
MRNLLKKIRQARCLHWFNPPVTMEFTEWSGAIVCCQQKHWTYTQETRTCSKCGLTDSRRVGEPVYMGWD